MGNRIKLTEPGSFHAFRVAKVGLNKSGKWPDYELDDGSGNVVIIPQKAADRQLGRLNIANALELVGLHLKVSRSDEPGENGKLFWNLDLVNASEAAPSKRIQPPSGAKPQGVEKPLPFDDGWEADGAPTAHVGHSAPPDAPLVGDPQPYAESAVSAADEADAVKRRALEEAYGDLFARCATRQLAIGQGAEIPFDLASVNAHASTVWISWKEAGLTKSIASSALQRHAEGDD